MKDCIFDKDLMEPHKIIKLAEDIDINKLPYVLRELFKSSNQYNFWVFCLLLGRFYMEIPFLPYLELYDIPLEHFMVFKMFLSPIFKNCALGICDCLALIYIHNIYRCGKPDKYDNELVNSLNIKLKDIKKYLSKKRVDNGTYASLGILLDMSSIIGNNETYELIKDFKKYNLNNEAKLFLIKALVSINLINEIPNSYFKDMYDDIICYNRLCEILTKLGKTSIMPKEYIDTEKLTKSGMIIYLMHPQELARKPDTIDFVDTMVIKGRTFYIYKFTSIKYKSRGSMIGINGPLEEGRFEILGINQLVYIYTKYETIEKDYRKQVIELYKTLENVPFDSYGRL